MRSKRWLTQDFVPGWRARRSGTIGLHKAIYHVLFWLVAYLFWVFIVRNGTLVFSHAVTVQFCYLVFIAANYYFNTLVTIPLLLRRKKYAGFVLLFLAGIGITAALRVPVFFWVSAHVFRMAAIAAPLSVFFDSFINILFWTGIILTARMIAERIQSQLYIEQIELEKSASELNFLRAQFNPHFLFNSINSIYGHIDKSNKDARGMLLTFSEMLRYQLYECNTEQIDLEKELQYISNYIALQKNRIDERIQVALCLPDAAENIKIAPLLLMTFIENAFKYVGLNEGRENRIAISLKHENDRLIFSVFNTKDILVKNPESGSGLGITNTRRRLELLYPARHELLIKDEPLAYEVQLTLQGI